VLLEVWRSGQVLRLPVPPSGAAPLLELLSHLPAKASDSPGYVFRRNAALDAPLTGPAMRAIIRSFCKAAGFPRATAHDLRAAFAHSLRVQGLSDHETARVLGLRWVRSLDQMLAGHKALDAQRQVRELDSQHPMA
jgi:integrase